jgi:lysophospholipase L1-like esterase
LRAIYQEIGAGADVFAVSIPTWSYTPAAAEFGGAAHVERMTGIFNAIAREEASVAGYTWIDLGPVSTSQIGRRGWLASDQLHPGDVQYAAWAEVIWPEVRDRVR